MANRLSLDVDGLRIESFATGDASGARGTVRAQELAMEAGTVTRTNCLTTPCCAPTVTCPPSTWNC